MTTTLGHSIKKNSVILGIFALFTAGVIATTFQSTETRIIDAEKQAEAKALFEIVPKTRHDNDLLETTIQLTPEQAETLNISPDKAVIHVASQNGQTVAYILQTVAPDGYSGDIKLLVGVNVDGSVAGVRVIQHRETPGLGDKIELKKSDWIKTFNGRSLNDPAPARWTVKRNGGAFDQLTGATITPRAVVRQVKEALLFVQQHKDGWRNEANPK